MPGTKKAWFEGHVICVLPVADRWTTGPGEGFFQGGDVDEKHGCGCVWKWLNGFSFKMTIYIFNVVGKMMINHQTLGFSIFKAMQCHASAWNHQYPWPFSHRLGNSNIPKLKGTIWKSGHLPWPRKITNIFFRQIIAKWFIFHSYVTGWCLPVLSWFMKPINYSYI